MVQRPRMRWLGRLLLLMGLTLFVMLPAAAWADDYVPTTTPTTTKCTTSSSSSVCGTSGTVLRVGGSSLPFTGGDVALLTVLGLAVLGAGGGLVWFGRRSHSTT